VTPFERIRPYSPNPSKSRPNGDFGPVLTLFSLHTQPERKSCKIFSNIFYATGSCLNHVRKRRPFSVRQRGKRTVLSQNEVFRVSSPRAVEVVSGHRFLRGSFFTGCFLLCGCHAVPKSALPGSSKHPLTRIAGPACATLFTLHTWPVA